METVREGFLMLDSDTINRFASRTVAGRAIFNARISGSDVDDARGTIYRREGYRSR
jgi:hypothetical protein